MEMIDLEIGQLMRLFYVKIMEYFFGCTKNMMINKKLVKQVNGNI